jgi:hypothetical protein
MIMQICCGKRELVFESRPSKSHETVPLSQLPWLKCNSHINIELMCREGCVCLCLCVWGGGVGQINKAKQNPQNYFFLLAKLVKFCKPCFSHSSMKSTTHCHSRQESAMKSHEDSILRLVKESDSVHIPLILGCARP